MRQAKGWIWLLLIVVVGAVLRLWMLPTAPDRLTQDEMSIGYNAYSILKTGRDEWGIKTPVIFQAFGDDKMPVYVYATVPLVWLLGLSGVAMKLPSVMAGLLVIIGVYFIGREVSKREGVGLMAALVVAVNPMPVHLSRSGLESNLALAFFTLGFYVLLLYIKQMKVRLGVMSGALWGLSMFTYIGYRVLVVGMWVGYGVVSLISMENVRLTLRKWLMPLLGILLVAIPLLLLGAQRSMTRFSQLNTTLDAGIQAESLEISNYCFMSGMPWLQKSCRFLFAPLIERVIVLFDNYVAFLLPTFLFIEGDQLAYLSNPKFGEYFLLWLPFLIVGLFSIINKRNLESKLLLLMFLIAPVAAALVGVPQIVRGSGIIVPISVLISIGVVYVFDRLPKNRWRWVILGGFGLLLAGHLMRYYSHYYYVYPKKEARAFYGIPNEVADYLSEEENEYERIYINDRFSNPHIFLAFWQQIDPSIYQNEIVRPDPDDLGFSHPTQLLNYVFGSDDLTTYLCDEQVTSMLYVTETGNKKIEESLAFTDFTGVHTEVFIYDIEKVRNKLMGENIFERVCPGM